MTTAVNLIERSLRLISVLGSGRRTANANELADGLVTLNAMMESMSIDRSLIYQKLEETHVLTVGVADYSIGSGGDINTARPVRIENAFIRDSAGYDYTMTQINNETYDSIGQKSIQSRPQYYFYDEIYPLAYIRLLYVPSATDTLHFNSWKQLQTFATATTALSLPLGYEGMIVYNLAVWLHGEYPGSELPATVIALAKSTMANVKKINSDPPLLAVSDPIMSNRGRGQRNIFTG